MSDQMAPVVIIERWPDIPGHPGCTTVTSATRKARTDDDRFWLVRPKGLFKRWAWLPRAGAYITIRETT